MEKRKVSFEEGGIYLSTWGNPNILRHHIYYFEKKIPEEINKTKMLPTPSITDCPNFAAWIRLFTELSCNKMYYNYHRFTGEDWGEIIKWGFEDVKKEIKGIIQNNKYIEEKPEIKLEDLEEAIESIIQLRHCFQHGGVPNILRKIDNKKMELIGSMLNPRKYKETKLIFEKAELFSELLPKPSITVGSK